MQSIDDILSLRVELLDYWREFHARADDLIQVYHGNYHNMWPEEFRRGEVPKNANWIKLSWDRFATMVGKLPSSHVPPSRIRRLTQAKADKVEKVLSWYDYSSGMKRLMKWYAWWVIGTGASAIGVMPDPILKGPRYAVRDPRTVLTEPGAGSVPTTSNSMGFMGKPSMTTASLNRVIINEVVTGSYIIDQFGDDAKYAVEGSNISTPQELITYMDKDEWQVIVNGMRINQVNHDLGYVPWRFTTAHVPDQLGGQSMFEQNIGLVLAFMRTLNQKLTYNKNVVWPWLVLKGLNDVNHDQRIIEILERDGDAQFLNPPAELQAERDLDVLDRLIRVMNHDTEVMQGEAPGSVVTGAGAREINRDVKNVVLDFWEVLSPDIEFVRSAALDLDEGLYGNVTKSMYGRTKGEQFEEEYKPKDIINGHRQVVADFGIGVGGQEGFIELMQAAAQGYVDEMTVIESLEWVKSASETRRKVLMDRLEKLLFEMTAGGAPAPVINHIGAWRQAVEKGRDPYKWLEKNPMPSPEMPAPGAEGPAPAGPGAPPEAGPPQVPSAPISPPSPQQLLALTQGRG